MVHASKKLVGVPLESFEKAAGSDSTALPITFRDSREFAKEFDRNLSNYGIFLPTRELRPIREIVDFVVVLPHDKREIPGKGEVIAVLVPLSPVTMTSVFSRSPVSSSLATIFPTALSM